MIHPELRPPVILTGPADRLLIRLTCDEPCPRSGTDSLIGERHRRGTRDLERKDMLGDAPATGQRSQLSWPTAAVLDCAGVGLMWSEVWASAN